MTNIDNKSRFYILHLEIAHGSDRYDIHIHMERPPRVRDLMEEIEKKARVTTINQQLLYRGERLHQTPDKPLEAFGLFNGNRIILVGEKLVGLEDEHFRRLLSIEKDANVINDVIEVICRDFENLKKNGQRRDQCGEVIHLLQARGARCRSDLKTFQTLATDLKVDSSEYDAYRKKGEVVSFIQDRLDILSNVVSAISSYQ